MPSFGFRKKKEPVDLSRTKSVASPMSKEPLELQLPCPASPVTLTPGDKDRPAASNESSKQRRTIFEGFKRPWRPKSKNADKTSAVAANSSSDVSAQHSYANERSDNSKVDSVSAEGADIVSVSTIFTLNWLAADINEAVKYDTVDNCVKWVGFGRISQTQMHENKWLNVRYLCIIRELSQAGLMADDVGWRETATRLVYCWLHMLTRFNVPAYLGYSEWKDHNLAVNWVTLIVRFHRIAYWHIRGTVPS